MKKFLAPIMAIAAVASFSSAVLAQSVEVEQEGTVKGDCTINKVTDGALPTNAGFVNAIESSTPGKISTLCNTKISTLKVELISPATETVASTGQAITRSYKLDGGTGAYATGFNQGAFGTADTSKTDISNNFSAAASTFDVRTKVAAATAGQNLAAGPEYKVKVKATVTP
jgi:hypothetical protein